MHFSNEDEVIAAIKQLLQDKSETLELYGNIVDRSTVLIDIYLGVKTFDITNFQLVFIGWYKLLEEFKNYQYSIHKYELDMDCWMSCGPIKGKFLTIDQAYTKLTTLDTFNHTFLYRIQSYN